MSSRPFKVISRVEESGGLDRDDPDFWKELASVWDELLSECVDDHVVPVFEETCKILVEWKRRAEEQNDPRFKTLTAQHVKFAKARAEQRLRDQKTSRRRPAEERS